MEEKIEILRKTQKTASKKNFIHCSRYLMQIRPSLMIIPNGVGVIVGAAAADVVEEFIPLFWNPKKCEGGNT